MVYAPRPSSWGLTRSGGRSYPQSGPPPTRGGRLSCGPGREAVGSPAEAGSRGSNPATGGCRNSRRQCMLSHYQASKSGEPNIIPNLLLWCTPHPKSTRLDPPQPTPNLAPPNTRPPRSNPTESTPPPPNPPCLNSIEPKATRPNRPEPRAPQPTPALQPQPT